MNFVCNVCFPANTRTGIPTVTFKTMMTQFRPDLPQGISFMDCFCLWPTFALLRGVWRESWRNLRQPWITKFVVVFVLRFAADPVFRVFKMQPRDSRNLNDFFHNGAWDRSPIARSGRWPHSWRRPRWLEVGGAPVFLGTRVSFRKMKSYFLFVECVLFLRFSLALKFCPTLPFRASTLLNRHARHINAEESLIKLPDMDCSKVAKHYRKKPATLF